MSTRSSTRNLFPPLDNPELTIRRRSRVNPRLLNNFEMDTDENGDLPVPDLRTMKELCQPTLNGRGGPIAPIVIQATNFGLKNNTIQQVQNSCQFHGLPGDDANKHLYKFLHVTQSGTFMKRHPEECYDLIENMTAHHNDWDTFAQWSESSSSVTSSSDLEIIALKAEMAEIKKSHETTVGQTRNVYAAGAYNQGENSYQPYGNRNLLSYRSDNYLGPQGFNQNQNRNNQNQNFQNQNRNQGNNHGIPQGNNQRRNQFFQGASHGQNPPPAYQAPAYQAPDESASSSGSGTLPSNIVTNTKEDLKGITTRSGNSYHGPMFPTTSSPPKLVERETEVTKDMVPPTNNESIKDINLRLSKLKSKCRILSPLLLPLQSPLLLPLVLRSPTRNRQYHIRMDECLALADLDASINLMPLSMWNKLFLPKLTPTLMTLKLADRLISRPIGIAKDVFVKVGKIHFLADFIVIDFDADPRVPQILKRSFLKTEPKNEKSSIDEPPEVELKDLPPHLKYAFLEGYDKLPVIIAKDLSLEEKATLIKVLKSHKRAIAWKLSDIKGINLELCTHKILMEDDFKLAVQHQRRVNPKIHDVIKKEDEKLLDVELIYSISDSPWVSSVHCVPKKGGFTIVENDENELIPTRLVTGWRVCIDYRKLNEATRKDHFRLPFMDQMLKRLVGNEYYCFLDGFSGYFQIPIDPKDQEKTTFTCPYGTFAYRRMPFGLCNC
nr:reverse transcriptase domain-containing protein [Tanacetum cinerariifolium]